MDKNTKIVIDGVQYEISNADYNIIRDIMVRSRADNVAQKNASATTHTTAPTAKEQLTDTVMQRLVGHLNVVYYNLDTNSWNTDKYNGCKISGHAQSVADVKFFIGAMERHPEFSSEYEFVAPVTMTIRTRSYMGFGDNEKNPIHEYFGRTVVGNIVARNKKTGQCELYCKSWVWAGNHLSQEIAAINGAWEFARSAGHDINKRRQIIATHNPKVR